MLLFICSVQAMASGTQTKTCGRSFIGKIIHQLVEASFIMVISAIEIHRV
jgi:hypothetical protein